MSHNRPKPIVCWQRRESHLVQTMLTTTTEIWIWVLDFQDHKRLLMFSSSSQTGVMASAHTRQYTASICLARKCSITVYFGTWKEERTSRIGEGDGEMIVGQPGRNAYIYEIVKQSGTVFLDTFFSKCQRFRINHNAKLRGWDGIDYSWMLHRSNIQLQAKAEVLSAYLIHCKSFPWHKPVTSLMATLTARYHVCLYVL